MGSVSLGTDEQVAVEAHLRRLDASALAAFVADLWAARGYETERDGTLVRATRAGESLLVRVGGETATDAPADIVVASSEVDSHEGTTVFDAADLAEQVWYAVERPAARELCTRHLGAPPADLSLPAGYLVQRWLPGRFPPVVPLVFVAAILVVAVVGLGVVLDDAGKATPAPGGQPEATAQPQSAPEVGAVSRSVNRFPPGVTSEGVGDVDTLATAHAEALENKSYTLELDRHLYDVRGQEVVDIHRDIDITVSGGRYLVSVDEIVDGHRTPWLTLYHDGNESYVATWDDGTVTYNLLTSVREERIFTPDPERITERVVRTRLSTPTTQMLGVVDRSGGPLYRVVGSGRPEWPGVGNVRGYSVTALLTPAGLVREVTAEYTARSGFSMVDVRRDVRYSRVGETRVVPPKWYEERFAENETNG